MPVNQGTDAAASHERGWWTETAAAIHKRQIELTTLFN